MRVIVGYGNNLRGEDGFGVDIIDELQNHILHDTRLIKTFQLTPELILQLIDADEIIFLDACFSLSDNYQLACTIIEHESTLTHHISPKMIIKLLTTLYDKKPNYFIYSMLTNNFDEIIDKNLYNKALNTIVAHLLS